MVRGVYNYRRSKHAVNFSLPLHNKALPVVAMCVNNPDCSPARVRSCDTASTPTGFAEIVSDDFPGFHLDFARIVACH